MTKLIPIALLLLTFALGQKKPYIRTIPRRVPEKPHSPPPEDNASPKAPEKAQPSEIPSAPKSKGKAPEDEELEPPQAQNALKANLSVNQEIQKEPKITAPSLQKSPEPPISKTVKSAKKSGSAKISESSKESPIKNEQNASPPKEPVIKKPEIFPSEKKDTQAENLKKEEKVVSAENLVKADEPQKKIPEQIAPVIEDLGTEAQAKGKGFGGHYEHFVQTNIELLEKILSIIREKAFPFYFAITSNKIASSIVVGFFYTFLILRLAMAIFPRKIKGSSPDQKFLQQNFDKLEAQIKELFAARPESERKLDAILKRLVDLQSALDALKSDKADDEFLDFLGKNIEDVWKEIGTIKSKINDNENSSNLDSFNARLESKPQAKTDKVATPEDLDFDAEGKLKFEDLGKQAREETGTGQELLPSALPRPKPKPLAPSLPKRPPLNARLPESPIKPLSSVKADLQGEGQAQAFEAPSEQIPNEKAAPGPSPPARTLLSQTSVNQASETDQQVGEQGRHKEVESAPGLPPKLPMNVNIFNKGKILPKTKNHITMPSMETMGTNKEARPVPPSTGEKIELVQDKVDEILPIEEPKEIPGQSQPLFETEKEPTSESKIAEKVEEKETLERPPLIAPKLLVRPSSMLKTTMKPLQMVRPLPKPQNLPEQSKGGEKGNLI